VPKNSYEQEPQHIKRRKFTQRIIQTLCKHIVYIVPGYIDVLKLSAYMHPRSWLSIILQVDWLR